MGYQFPDGNTIWSPESIIALLCLPGYMSPDDWRPITGCAVVIGESGGNPLARGRVIWRPGTTVHRSMAFGLFQLLSHYHVNNRPFPDIPAITVADCFDPFKAWDHTWRVLKKQTQGWAYNWNGWDAYTNGSYKDHISASVYGMKDYRKTMGLGPGPFTS
jgi:hypothetical protein